MNCTDYKSLMTIDVFGKLTSEEIKNLKDHIRVCPSCAERYEKTRPFSGGFQAPEDIPFPDWEKSWQVILSQTTKRKKPDKVMVPYRRLVFAGAAFVIVFVVGFIAGRHFFLSGPPRHVFRKHDTSGFNAPISSYAESTELLLINFMNRRKKQNQEEVWEFERKIILDILVQTRILGLLISKYEEPFMRELIEDVELILVSITNLKPGDEDAAAQLDRFIRENHLKERLHRLAAEKIS